MKVDCLDCDAVYTIDPARVPPDKVFARCKACGGIVPLNAKAKASKISDEGKTPAYRAGYIAGYDDVIEGRDGEPGNPPPSKCPYTSGAKDALEWLNGYGEGLDAGDEQLEHEKEGYA